jgi:DNA-binding CsgD family transcriptional regulator
MSEWQVPEAPTMLSESTNSLVANRWAVTAEKMPNTAPLNQPRTMNCRFDDILTFIRVVEAGSVTSAATLMNVSKSVISKRIGDLEGALRVELFDRSTDNVKPTELARAFYERVVPLIQVITEASENCINGLMAAWGGWSRTGTEVSARSSLKDPLSARESAILKLIADGLSNKEIARILAIAPETVKSHIKNLFGKLNAEKRAQAVAHAQSLGLVGTC